MSQPTSSATTVAAASETTHHGSERNIISDKHNNNAGDTKIGHRVDPSDWTTYRADLHQLVDACCERMKNYRHLPWQPPPSDFADPNEVWISLPSSAF